jgi:hypothetical protein
MSEKRVRFLRDRLNATLKIDVVVEYPCEPSEAPHVAICCLAGRTTILLTELSCN